jgi:hypothetical protein
MEQVILYSLTIYFIFFLLNQSKLGGGFRKCVDERYNLWKVTEDWRRHLIYPIRECAFCFAFWISVFHGQFKLAPQVAVVTLFLDLALKKLICAKSVQL